MLVVMGTCSNMLSSKITKSGTYYQTLVQFYQLSAFHYINTCVSVSFLYSRAAALSCECETITLFTTLLAIATKANGRSRCDNSLAVRYNPRTSVIGGSG